MSARLKSLTLYGFKSFVQRTQLELDSGITAVVGPNGSGKSNLADAVRWALGEQSLRTIRGRRTEDVLFSGGNGRPPAGFAEVAVTFESTENTTERSASFPYSELSIARRAYRSGENEYYVNGERVRLKDIVDICGQLGVGLDGFCLVGQNEVDAALSARAEDRRELVAQAAGLGHLQGRLADSLSKLSLTEQNLARVADLIEELAPRLRTLERQARQAKERETLQDEFCRGLVRWYADRWSVPWQCRRDATLDLAAAEVAAYRSTQLQTSRATGLAESLHRLADVTIQLDGANHRLESLTTEIETNRRTVESHEDRLESLQRRQTEAVTSEQHWQDALADESTALAELDRQRCDLLSSSEQIGRELVVASRAVDGWQREKQALAESVRLERGRLSNAELLRARACTRAHELEERLAQSNASLAAHRRHVSQLEADVEAQTKATVELGSICENFQVVVKERDTRLKTAASECERLTRLASTAAGNLKAVNREFHVQRTRLEAMQSVEESGAGYFLGVRAVLRAAQSLPAPALAGVVGIVARLLDVPDDLEVAIETALGSHGQDIVVVHWADAEAAISFLKSTGGGRATFLPLDTLRSLRRPSPAQEGPGIIGVATKLVGIDPRFAIVSEFLLGSTLVVDDLRVARSVLQVCASSWQIVTRDGEVARPTGAVTGGSAATTRGVLARQRELRTTRRLESEVAARRDVLALEAAAADAEENRSRSEVATAGHELNEARDTLRQSQTALRDALLREERSTQLVAIEHADTRRRQAELASLDRQQADAQTQAVATLEEVETATAALETAETMFQAFEATRNDTSATAFHLRSKLESEQRALKGLAADRARIEVRRHAILDRIREYASQLDASREEMCVVAERLEVDRRRQAELVALQAGALNLVARLQVEQIEARERHDRLAAENHRLEIDCRNVEESARQASARLERANVELDGLRRQILLELGTIDEVALDDGNLTVQSTDRGTCSAPLEAIPSDERLKERLDGMRSRLKFLTAGADVVAEYESARDRTDFLRRQHEDLTRSTQTLRHAIDETRATMRDRFDLTFARVSAAFSRQFADLFGGGTAMLSLDPDGDGAGIDVIAQPPGKRAQGLATLSGGERALTAASLLFALIEASPPPFCLLDEVDAALDENNVTRFCTSLKKLSDRTQFVVITHNRRTMEAASVICGLALEGRCESRVLSIRLPIER